MLSFRPALIAASVAACLLSSVRAESLLETPNVGFSVEAIQFGENEVDRIFGTTYGMSALANFVVAPKVDLLVRGSYVETEDSRDETKYDYKSVGVDASLVYYHRLKKGLTPYVRGGLVYVDNDLVAHKDGVRIPTGDSETGLDIGGGLEWICCANALLTLDAGYLNIDEEDGTYVGATAGYWLNENTLVFLSGSHDFNDETRVASLGVLVKR